MNRILFVLALVHGTVAADELPAVLLRSGQVLRGTATQSGDQIEIELPHGTIRLDRQQVLCWGPSLLSLYDYRVDHRPKDSVRHHLDDARWCIDNGLFSEAVSELIKVRQLVGDHKEANALEQLLLNKSSFLSAMPNEEESSASPSGSNLNGQEAGTRVPALERPERGGVTSGETEQLPPKLFSSQSVQYFTTHVQPMLVNRCATAGCHGSRPMSPPQLEGWRYGVSAPITNRNLRALAKYFNERAGAAGENRLFKMATTPHGGSHALTIHESLLQKRLAEWIEMVGTTKEINQQDSAHGKSQTPNYNRAANEQERTVAPTIYHQPTGTLQQKPSTPSRFPAVTDPYDPEIFNKVYGSR